MSTSEIQSEQERNDSKVTRNPARILRGIGHRAREVVRALRTSQNPLLALLFDPQYRWKFWVRLTKPRNVHQVAARTRMNRYPEVFSAVRELLGGSGAVTLLSFGASTGEEVVTLREYLPHARIIGAEVNPRLLKIAQARDLDDGITFVYSNEQNIAAHGPYDAVFCMAVLQRDPQLVVRNNVTNLRKQYPFEQFEEMLLQLDQYVKPGGLLIVHHSHYLVTDSSLASRYEPLSDEAGAKDRYAKFDRSGQRIGLEVETQSIFRKLSPMLR